MGTDVTFFPFHHSSSLPPCQQAQDWEGGLRRKLSQLADPQVPAVQAVKNIHSLRDMQGVAERDLSRPTRHPCEA